MRVIVNEYEFEKIVYNIQKDNKRNNVSKAPRNGKGDWID